MTSRAAGLLEPIPANAAFGIRILTAADGSAEAVMPTTPNLANVVGSMHSSGLIALIDATCLAAIIAMSDDEASFEEVVPLGVGQSPKWLNTYR